ncbi:MAG: hypothetical protein DLM53_05155 [Candidatus Eremiobacter antarcticus]|nr:hypothetical protein [Candidatus Eremiobacteraeota bacterium]MBC5807079.1 hypothetical protein [Candidatus Eremiobacteraeota bacterium]PZR62796.1 MAG: hypothetical protein DLM53_05155 [Candidatus Eremiobacter sp. RRmetagenome_bin22]
MTLNRIASAACTVAAAFALCMTACSTNAGFGTPSSGAPPLNNGYPQNGAMPLPSGASPLPSGAVSGPYNLGPNGGPGQPQAGSSPAAMPSALPDTVSIAGATLHLAYDGAATDPMKAARILEVSFALQNTTSSAKKVSSISVASDTGVLGTRKISVSASPNQMSAVALVTVRTSDDPRKFKQLKVDFLNDAGKSIASSTLDVPVIDQSVTPLDEHHPKGDVSIDSVDVSRVDANMGQKYEVTFAVTNPTNAQVSITHLAIAPPKGAVARVVLPLNIAARSVSSFVSVVLPYNGKSLPAGSYTVSAMKNSTTVAKASSSLL